jgi:putative ATPase
MQVALSAWDCFHRIGPAEGERAIAQAIVYLACPQEQCGLHCLEGGASSPRTCRTSRCHRTSSQCTDQADERAGLRRLEYRYAHDEPGAYAAGEQ